MGLVVVIDPGRRQGTALERIARDLPGHDIVVVGSCAEALDALETGLPHLVVFPLFLAPGDEARLQVRLRELPSRNDIRALTLPLAACAEGEREADRPTAVPPRWFYWFRPPAVDGMPDATPGELARLAREDFARQVATAGDGAAAYTSERPSSAADPTTAEVASHPVFAPGPAPAVATPYRLATPAPSVESIVIDRLAHLSETEARQPTLADERDVTPRTDVWSRPGSDWEVPRPATHGGQARGDDAPGRLVAVKWRVPQGAYLAAAAVGVLLMLGVSGRALMETPINWLRGARSAAVPVSQATGTVDLQSAPAGAYVFIAGKAFGLTPLRTELPVGEHDVEFRQDGSAQTVRLTVRDGATVTHRVEWKSPRATGSLSVESQPSGASVLIDGKTVGVTPLVVDDVSAGSHEVELKLGANTVRRTIDIKAGKVNTFDSGVYGGWLALFSPIELTVREGGRVLALDERNRVMLPAGDHELTFENRALGFRETRSIHVAGGEVTAESLEVPKTQLTVTAPVPMEIWVDGSKAGETPLVDWPVDIGTREIVARAAGRAERKLTVTATVQPVHVSVD